MSSIAKLATLSILTLSCLSHSLLAQSVGTLSCPATPGNYLPALSAPVYAFTFEVDQTENLLDATIYLDVSALPLLLFSESGTYSQCTIVTPSETVYFYNAINQGVSGTAIAGGYRAP